MLLLIQLTACKTTQAESSKFSLSNTTGRAFVVTGSSAASPEQLKKEMTYRAVREAQRRGYPVIALVRNSHIRTENGFHHMTASHLGLKSFAEAVKRQAVAVNSYAETDGVSHQTQTKNPGKYGEGLLLPTTREGRAVDAMLKRVSEVMV
ncbi:hypothetical protein O8B93_22050 [Agrobacterium rhizogenes]|uniref:hypothetical protein n=1 Tax=Rhizobium rhizogenes TaxID=359 RepID=UPI0022B5EC0C|nr:hypothetical protein [Rhizobium rhizogenes]MCZ7450271.1 hypothetical protein [Rhizobium rhizogenes]